MKRIIPIIVITLSVLTLGSCKKCYTCIVKDQDGVKRYEYPEVCGSKKDLSAYSDKCEDDYGKYDHTCVCSESL